MAPSDHSIWPCTSPPLLVQKIHVTHYFQRSYNLNLEDRGSFTRKIQVINSNKKFNDTTVRKLQAKIKHIILQQLKPRRKRSIHSHKKTRWSSTQKRKEVWRFGTHILEARKCVAAVVGRRIEIDIVAGHLEYYSSAKNSDRNEVLFYSSPNIQATRSSDRPRRLEIPLFQLNKYHELEASNAASKFSQAKGRETSEFDVALGICQLYKLAWRSKCMESSVSRLKGRIK